MKTLSMTLLVLLACTNSFANVAFNIEGELIILDKMNSPLEISITTEDKVYEITNVHLNYTSCEEGEYVIVQNMFPLDTYLLLDVINCIPKADNFELNQKSLMICPEIYMPVCGQPKMPKCEDQRVCIQVMPKPQIFGNFCELKVSDASPLPMEMCDL